jgi:hypothetical protein
MAKLSVSNIDAATASDNFSISATVASKILTVALKGEDGNDPAAGNIVNIKFRSATLTDSKPVTRSITSPKSVALASGGTLGFTSALAGRLYVWAIDNAGTVELALSRTADIFQESNLVTTVAIDSGSDSASVMYSTIQRTSLPCRCLGYVEITTGATAGEWDNAPTKVQVMRQGVKRTGDIIQVVSVKTGEYSTGTTVIPYDDTIPQITEGDFLMSVDIIPTSTLNKLSINCTVLVSTNGGTEPTVALFKAGTNDALAVLNTYAAANEPKTFALSTTVQALTTSSLTISARGGCQAGNAFYFNGYLAARKFGGAAGSSIIVTEIFA